MNPRPGRACRAATRAAFASESSAASGTRLSAASTADRASGSRPLPRSACSWSGPRAACTGNGPQHDRWSGRGAVRLPEGSAAQGPPGRPRKRPGCRAGSLETQRACALLRAPGRHALAARGAPPGMRALQPGPAGVAPAATTAKCSGRRPAACAAAGSGQSCPATRPRAHPAPRRCGDACAFRRRPGPGRRPSRSARRRPALCGVTLPGTRLALEKRSASRRPASGAIARRSPCTPPAPSVRAPAPRGAATSTAAARTGGASRGCAPSRALACRPPGRSAGCPACGRSGTRRRPGRAARLRSAAPP